VMGAPNAIDAIRRASPPRAGAIQISGSSLALKAAQENQRPSGENPGLLGMTTSGRSAVAGPRRRPPSSIALSWSSSRTP
jgi:hypothetical protein